MLNFLSGGFLKGYRTYILGGLLLVTAVAQFTTGDMSLPDLFKNLPALLAGLGLWTARAAV